MRTIIFYFFIFFVPTLLVAQEIQTNLFGFNWNVQTPYAGTYAELDKASQAITNYSEDYITYPNENVQTYAFNQEDDEFYFINYTQGNYHLITLNSNTGEKTNDVILDLPEEYYIKTLRYNRQNKTLYGIYWKTVAFPNGQLCRVNPLTGSYDLISDNALFSWKTTLTSDFINYNTNEYCGFVYNADKTVQNYVGISLSTGEITSWQSINNEEDHGLRYAVFNYLNGEIYVINWLSSGTIQKGRVAQLNLTNGEVTNIGKSYVIHNGQALYSYTIDPYHEKFYGLNYSFPQNVPTLHEVNLANGSMVQNTTILTNPGFEFRALHLQYWTESTSSIEESTNENQWKIFPNPSHHMIEHNFPLHRLKAIKAIGIDGKEIDIIAQGNQLNISMLSNGIYTLRFYFSDQIINKQLIKW